MTIKHFYDEALAQGSYAIESNGLMALVDPWRDPKEFIEYATQQKAKIAAIFETHPHADFISSHLELSEITGAPVYIHEKAGAIYPHTAMAHGDEVKVGGVTFKALFTPGHSPDHNSYLLVDEHGKDHAVFTGDSLFVGDVGRPDLREGTGHLKVDRKELASMMFDTIHDVFAALGDEVVVYPAHGAGSLCGKNLSDDLSSTIGRERQSNWAFAMDDREKFVQTFLEGQAFIPQYFPNSVEVNRRGAKALKEALSEVVTAAHVALPTNATVIDVRDAEEFRKGHLPGSIHIQCRKEDKFETWLGSMVAPTEKFYLVASNRPALEAATYRAAKIGYETLIISGLINPLGDKVRMGQLDLEHFRKNPKDYTVVDVRNASEMDAGKVFDHAMHLPLHALRGRLDEIPADKPVIVHCAGGYRSAIGASVLKGGLDVKVFDLSEDVKAFQEEKAAAG